MEPGIGDGQESSESCTLLVTGFPENSSDRELENFCRFLPGFGGAKSSFKKFPQVFVKFESHAQVLNAMQWVDQQPFDLHDQLNVLKGHIARKELNIDMVSDRQSGAPLQSRNGVGPSLLQGSLNALLGLAEAPGNAWQAAAHAHWPSEAYMTEDRPSKRPRWEAEDGGMDTLYIRDIVEKKQTESSIASLFSGYKGYVTLRLAKHAVSGIENCFIKFASAADAQAALHSAPAWLEADMARRSLDLSVGSAKQSESWSAVAAPMPKGGAWPHFEPKGGKGKTNGWGKDGKDGSWGKDASWGLEGGWGKGGKSQGKVGDSPDDTIVVMNAIDKGYTEETLTEHWPSQPGFCAMRISPHTGKGTGGQHCFIKFVSTQHSHQALQKAKELGWDCDIARSSLNVSQATLLAATYDA